MFYLFSSIARRCAGLSACTLTPQNCCFAFLWFWVKITQKQTFQWYEWWVKVNTSSKRKGNAHFTHGFNAAKMTTREVLFYFPVHGALSLIYLDHVRISLEIIIFTFWHWCPTPVANIRNLKSLLIIPSTRTHAHTPPPPTHARTQAKLKITCLLYCVWAKSTYDRCVQRIQSMIDFWVNLHFLTWQTSTCCIRRTHKKKGKMRSQTRYLIKRLVILNHACSWMGENELFSYIFFEQ